MDTDAENALQKLVPKTSKLQKEFEERKKRPPAYEKAQEDLRIAQITAENYSRRFKEKVETVEEAAKACYVDAPAAPAASPQSP